MFKKIGIGFLILLLVLIIIIAVGKNIIVKAAVTKGVKIVTGLNMQIDSVNIGIANTLLGIKGLVLYNPDSFEDRVMMDLPEIYVDYDFGALVKKNIHLSELRLNLNEFVVIKNKQGVLNIDSLTAVQTGKKTEPVKTQEPEAQPAEKLQIKIDLMKLKIGKVIYKDYSKGNEPFIRTLNLNIDEEYENITDPEAVVRIIVVKVLTNQALTGLTNFKFGSLSDNLPASVNMLGDGAEGNVVKNTAEKLKNLLPFGK
jgi:uncharacterized protein involved in outer membrane biogenesis